MRKGSLRYLGEEVLSRSVWVCGFYLCRFKSSAPNAGFVTHTQTSHTNISDMSLTRMKAPLVHVAEDPSPPLPAFLSEPNQG